MNVLGTNLLWNEVKQRRKSGTKESCSPPWKLETFPITIT